jgi:hypothetical protein
LVRAAGVHMPWVEFAFIVGRLEAEAFGRSLNYVGNIITDTHPDPSA